MTKRLIGTISLFFGVFLTVVGAALVLLPGTTSAEPMAQRDPFGDTACLDCHTDQQRLQELTAENDADEPEEASLSSGPG